MPNRLPPELDLLPDGSFRPRQQSPFATRVFRWALIIAALAVALAVAALALWFALIMIPVALGAAAIAWLAFRYQVWKARRQVGPGGGDVWRP